MTTPTVTPDETRRLAFIKYLYRLAVEQSQRPEPMKAASILTFHDAVELFLVLAAQHLEVFEKKLEFAGYLTVIKKKLPGEQMPLKGKIIALNEARVGLKHYDNPPASALIDRFRNDVTTFFEENTPVIFDGRRFEDISMVDLVQCDAARASLEEAQRLMSAANDEEAIGRIALAFIQLVDDYHNRAALVFGQSPVDFHKPLLYESKLQGPQLPGPSSRDFALAGLVEDLTTSVRQMQPAVTVISMGLDFRRFARFVSLTPLVWKDPPTQDYVVNPRNTGYKLTPEDCRFCYDFVIESALRLQEFDFDVK